MRRFQLGVTLLGAVLCAVLCGSGAAAANAAWFQAEGPLSKTGFTPGSLPTGAAVVWKFGLTVACVMCATLDDCGTTLLLQKPTLISPGVALLVCVCAFLCVQSTHHGPRFG